MDWYEQAVTGGIEAGWIDKSASTKRLNGLEIVHKKMDPDSQAALPPMVICSQSIRIGGLTLQRDTPDGFVFVYLSPTLEHEWHINATFAVAHELAHVVLGHGKYRLRNKAEADADEKAASDLADTWVPEHSRFLRLLGRVEELEKLEHSSE